MATKIDLDALYERAKDQQNEWMARAARYPLRSQEHGEAQGRFDMWSNFVGRLYDMLLKEWPQQKIRTGLQVQRERLTRWLDEATPAPETTNAHGIGYRRGERVAMRQILDLISDSGTIA